MRWNAALPPVLLALGLGLATVAVVEGPAHGALLGTVPALTGASIEFGIGVAFLIAGFVAMSLTSAGAWTPSEPATEGEDERGSPEGRTEGVRVLVVGSIPVFVGAWRDATTSARRAAMILGSVGALLLVVAVLFY